VGGGEAQLSFFTQDAAMILLTGWSDKLDGIAFLADTDDPTKAITMFCDAWNDRFSDKVRVVHDEDNTYLLFADVEDSVVSDLLNKVRFEDGAPRREGWQIIGQEAKPGEVIQGCPW